MNILGIGPVELVIVVVIILLVLGPEDLEKTGRTVGKWINNFTKSDGWTAIRSISRELRGLPSRLAREAELDTLKDQLDPDKLIGDIPDLKIPELKEPLKPAAKKVKKAVSTTPEPSTPAEKPTENEKKK